MKIENILDSSNITPEWEDFYIEGVKLKILLDPLKSKSEIITTTAVELRLSISWGVNLLNQQTGDDSIYQIAQSFQDYLVKELSKVSFFYVENIEYYINRLERIKKQLKYVEKKDSHSLEMKQAEDQLEIAIKEMYKELHLLKNFLSANFNVETILINKIIKWSKGLFKEDYVSTIVKNIKSHSLDALISADIAGKIQMEVEKLFNRYYYHKYMSKSDKILSDYANSTGAVSSSLQIFTFGVFIGFIIMIISLIFLLSSHFNIDADTDLEYFQLFPIFRGVFLICTYMWLWAINVYYWNKNGINYKLVLQFDNHYSDLPTQLKRAAGLTTVVCVSMLYYFLIRTKTGDILQFVNFIPIKFTPLIGWIVFFVYMFFPSKDYFNYKGRMWFFRMIYYSFQLKEFIPCMWFMSQFASFAGGLRDLAYTFCYYYNFNLTPIEISAKCDERGFAILFFSLSPFFLRMIHSAKLAYYQGKYYPQFIISLRYFFSILATYLCSVMLMVDIKYLLYWFVAVLWSAMLSFYFDLKMDWGFLDKNSPNYPLRAKLCFKDRLFYHICIVMNFFGRFVWVLTVNPQLIYQLMRPQFVLTIFFFAELIRKAFWNFIYVENKHIIACSTFRATVLISLPFTIDEKNKDEYILKPEAKSDVDKVKDRLNKIRDHAELYAKKGKEEFVNQMIEISKLSLKDYIS